MKKPVISLRRKIAALAIKESKNLSKALSVIFF